MVLVVEPGEAVKAGEVGPAQVVVGVATAAVGTAKAVAAAEMAKAVAFDRGAGC